jgi:hypothetical protein
MEQRDFERFFTNNPALRGESFFPPEDVWPEVAHFRKEHQRLLGVVQIEAAALGELLKRHEAEDATHGDALRESFLANGKPPEDEREAEGVRATELADAKLRVDAATEALIAFLVEALAEVKAQCPEWYELLEERREEAEAKVEEARRLAAEAERAVAEAQLIQTWLDRFSGVSALGYIAYSDLRVSGVNSESSPLPALSGVQVN